MKLSKNRLNKIKRNKNHSKRKKVFRKKKHSYKNTQKKNRKQHNLKNKTLKIYVGGKTNNNTGYTRLRDTDNRTPSIIVDKKPAPLSNNITNPLHGDTPIQTNASDEMFNTNHIDSDTSSTTSTNDSDNTHINPMHIDTPTISTTSSTTTPTISTTSSTTTPTTSTASSTTTPTTSNVSSTTTPTAITNRINNSNNTIEPTPKKATSTFESYNDIEKYVTENKLTDKQITDIFNKLKKNYIDETLSLSKLYQFIVGNVNKEDAKIVRSVIGLDENKQLTVNDIRKGRDSSYDDLEKQHKNIQIIESLLKTFKGYNLKQKGGNDNNNSEELDSNDNSITLNNFRQFINCGQYRDKSKNMFDCEYVKPNNNKASSTINTNENTNKNKTNDQSRIIGTKGNSKESKNIGSDRIPEQQGNTGTDKPNDQARTNGTTRNTEKYKTNETNGTDRTDEKSGNSKQSNNIELSIEEKELDDKKHVDISIIIPKDGNVIVRDYAKQTAQEMIANL